MNIKAALEGMDRSQLRARTQKAARKPKAQDPAQGSSAIPPTYLRPFLKDLICYNKGEVVIRVVYVIGKQRTGKTVLVNSMVSEIQAAEKELVDYRITNDLKDLLSHEWMIIKNKPIFIRFIDDAGRMQFSRRGMEKQQLTKIIDMKEIAHIAIEGGFKEGCILVFYGSQNETLVDYQLRTEAEITIVKWLNLSIKEHRELIEGLKNFTDKDREDVEKWIDGIRLRQLWALSKAFVILPTRKWGWYYYKRLDPKIEQELKHYLDEEGENVINIEHKEQPIPIRALSAGETDLRLALESVLEEMIKDKNWSLRAQCYKMVRDGATERDAALKILGSADKQGTVNKWKKSAQGEAKRRLGAIYENVITLRLSKEGYAVQHLGGSGEPDILATKDGKLTVVSCKIYEDPKKLVSIDPIQFRPESQTAAKNNLEKFLLFFYNLSWGKEIIRELDRDTGTVTIRLSETVKA